jgi:hypothetical protein
VKLAAREELLDQYRRAEPFEQFRGPAKQGRRIDDDTRLGDADTESWHAGFTISGHRRSWTGIGALFKTTKSGVGNPCARSKRFATSFLPDLSRARGGDPVNGTSQSSRIRATLYSEAGSSPDPSNRLKITSGWSADRMRGRAG